MQVACLNHPAGEYVIHQPFTVYLAQVGASHEAGAKEHLVSRLEDALQMRWISLGERKLLCELLECNTPRDGSRFAGDLEKPIQPPSDRAAQ